jgi:hypothetical protein
LTFSAPYGDFANLNPTTTEVIHGKETGNKIPRRQESQHHNVSLESQASGSGARKEADYPALDEDTNSTCRLRKETSQTNSARDAVLQPEYAYLAALLEGSARFSVC